MADTMRAAVLRAPHTVEVAEVPVPEITEPGDILLKVERTAICGTDLHPYEGRLDVEADIVLGHEFLGTVVAAGEAVGQFTTGDRVVSSCVVSCGSCYQCRRHQRATAQARGSSASAWRSEIWPAPGRVRRRPQRRSQRPPDSRSGVSRGRPVRRGCSVRRRHHDHRYEAVARSMRPGDTVAVVGAGRWGCVPPWPPTPWERGKVIVVDKVAARLKEAENLGAIAVNADETTPADAVLDLTEWRGADVVVDAVGHESAMLSAITWCGPAERCRFPVSTPRTPSRCRSASCISRASRSRWRLAHHRVHRRGAGIDRGAS